MQQDINNLGTYANIAAVWAAYPEGGQEGDYLYIGSTKYRWNKYDQIWENASTVTEGTARKLTELFADVAVNNDLRVGGTLYYHRLKGYDLGLYSTLASLQAEHPSPKVGMWAFVVHPTISGKYQVYQCSTAGEWTLSVSETTLDILDFEQYETTLALMQQIANGAQLAGYRAAESLSDLPTTDVDPTLGWIVGNKLYVYVGSDGDTLNGMYKDCGYLRGAKGDKGDKGDNGTVLDGVTVFSAASSLDGKTTAQKEAMVPDGNAMTENNIRSYGDMTNLFSFTNGSAITAGTGSTATSSQFAYSDYVALLGDVKRIRIKLPRWNTSAGAATGWGIAFYDSSKVYISGVGMEKYRISTSVKSTGDTLEYIIDVPDGASYMRTTYFATTSSFYDNDFYCYFNDAGLEHAGEIWRQAKAYETDLSDINFEEGKAINATNTGSISTSSNFALSDYVAIYGASEIEVTMPKYTSGGGVISGYGTVFFDESRNMIKGISIPIYEDDDVHTYTNRIAVPRNAYYVRVTYWTRSSVYYQPFSMKADGLKPKVNKLSAVADDYEAEKAKAFKFDYKFIGSPSVYRSASTGTGTVSIDYENLCTLYDQLALDYPSIFTREENFGTATGDYELRRYSIAFTPKVFGSSSSVNLWDENLMGRRRIFVCAGVHGDECASTYGVYLSIKEIIESNDDWAVFIKSNFIVDVCPCLNPWGLDHNDRENGNNVDINRDFDDLSQPESQAFASLLQSLPNLYAVIDNHNTVAKYGYLVSGETYKYKYHYSMVSAQLASALHSNFATLYNNTALFPYEGHQITDSTGQTHWYVNNVLGIYGVTSEVPRGDNGTFTNTYKYIEVTKDICINLIMMLGGK